MIKEMLSHGHFKVLVAILGQSLPFTLRVESRELISREMRCAKPSAIP